MQSLRIIFSTRRYLAPAWVFASLNIMIGTWVLYIPYVKDTLAITDGQLGVALFFLSMGTLSMVPVAPKVIHRFGAGKATFFGILAFAVIFQLPLLMDSYYLLCGALFLTGMGASLTDISMNSLVSEIEKEDDVHFLSASHGFFSLGGVLGAGVGSLLIIYFGSPQIHMFLAMLFVVGTNLLFYRSYIDVRGDDEVTDNVSFTSYVVRSLIALGVISFIIMGSEGAIEHWSKLFMQDVVHVTSEQIAGFGFVAFSATMTVGRFYGDSLSKKMGAYAIIIGGCLLSIFGYIALLQATTTLALIGFALIGAGYSVVIPELFRLAGKSKNVPSATGISFVAGVGYVGFLVSPAIMGFLSEIQGLELSFTSLMLSTIAVMFMTLLLKWRDKRK